MEDPQYVVGIDLSLVSPAIAVYCSSLKTWHLYCFAQRICEKGAVLRPSTEVIMTVLPPIPGSQTASDCTRYEHIRYHIHQVIALLAPRVTVYVEGYAYSRQNNATYKLQELGGIIKYDLFKLLGRDCETIPPSKWKKGCSGHGKLSKLEMVDLVQGRGPTIDLFKLFRRERTQNIPCPLQDIADAVGIVLSIIDPVPKVKKRKLNTTEET